MTKIKDVTLCIRTTTEIKELLRLAAERERRSVASMVEMLVLAHAEKFVLNDAEIASPKKRKVA